MTDATLLIGMAAVAVTIGSAAARAQTSPGAMPGQWQITRSGGTDVCHVTLATGRGGNTATPQWTPACKKLGLLQLKRCTWNGKQLALLDALQKPIVRLEARGPGMFEGEGYVVQRLGAPVKTGPRRMPTLAQLAGPWTFTREGSTETCAVKLAVGGGDGGAHIAKAAFGLACNGLGLFHLRQWSLAGGTLVLIDSMSKEIARLDVEGPNLLRGRGVAMKR